MAELEEKILQDAAYRPIVLHDQDPHTIVNAAREIPVAVDSQVQDKATRFPGLVVWSTRATRAEVRPVPFRWPESVRPPVTAGAARAPGWHTIETVSKAEPLPRFIAAPPSSSSASFHAAGGRRGRVGDARPSTAAKDVSACGSARP